MLTVNEIFCRNDYPASSDLRVVVDLGSNIGISALYFLSRNDESRCYLFEPDPKNIPRLHDQLHGFNGRYYLSECAVADRDGLVAFGVEDTGRYGGIGIDTGKSITVTCQNINSVLEEIIGKEGIVDVLKIDIEGVEITVVKAIREDLLCCIRYIYLEADPKEDLLPGKFSQKQYGSVCQLTNIQWVAT
jgi:FkbM family methyltransferase